MHYNNSLPQQKLCSKAVDFADYFKNLIKREWEEGGAKKLLNFIFSQDYYYYFV